MRRSLLALGLVLVAALGGCQTQRPVDDAPAAQAAPFQPCPASTRSPAAGPATLPAIALPCFVGDGSVVLAGLGQPAVINFWASYCRPCREELPQLQRFADAAGGKLVVMGVVTTDIRSKAAGAATDFGVRFPAVFDPDGTLLSAVGRNFLPVTLFVDADGRIRHEDISGALTTIDLVRLARQHLGVEVS